MRLCVLVPVLPLAYIDTAGCWRLIVVSKSIWSTCYSRPLTLRRSAVAVLIRVGGTMTRPVAIL